MREVVKISLGGVQFFLRPTFEAYGEIEAQCGMPLRQVYTSCVTGMTPLEQLARIVLIGLQQVSGQAQDQRTGASFTAESIATRLYENGVWSDATINPIADFLASLGWTPEQRKKINAELEKQEQQTTRSA